MSRTSDPPAALLECRGLGRRSGADGTWLLRNISLALGGGERIALTGPSGSGKTLLLRSLAQLDPPEEGEVLWRGAAVADDKLPEFRSRVVYLHQRPALWEGTVEENLRRPLALRSHRDRNYQRNRAEEMLQHLGRGDRLLTRAVGELSGGEAQLVAVVRALLVDPLVLLLDEPTAALDVAATEALQKLVLRWHGEAPQERAYVWISHDLAQARQVAERIETLRSGELVPARIVREN